MLKLGDEVSLIKPYSIVPMGTRGVIERVKPDLIYPYGVNFPGERSIRFFNEQEIKLVLPLKGKYVRATRKPIKPQSIEFYVREDKYGYVVTNTGLRLPKADYNFEILPEPIVLPDGKNALIEVGITVYRNVGYNMWRNTSGTAFTTPELTSQIQANPDSRMRIIFKGE